MKISITVASGVGSPIPKRTGKGMTEQKPRTHLVIPDTQAKPGTPNDALGWVGQYIVEKQPDVIVHLGDHFDGPSLSSYDVGKKDFEGRRYRDDVDAANVAFDVLCEPMETHNRRKAKQSKKQYKPELVILHGNHEQRIQRAIDDDAAHLDGIISLDDLNYSSHGWQVVPFLKPICIDGVWYAHYWANPMTGRPFGGNATTRLKQVGHSFTMGHQQVLDYAIRFVAGRSQHALIAGSCYLHTEKYLGPQGNDHWRGCIVKHQVEQGSYDPMFVSLDYLCRRFEGVPLAKFMAHVY
jgi:hypothetical protein